MEYKCTQCMDGRITSHQCVLKKLCKLPRLIQLLDGTPCMFYLRTPEIENSAGHESESSVNHVSTTNTFS